MWRSAGRDSLPKGAALPPQGIEGPRTARLGGEVAEESAVAREGSRRSGGPASISHRHLSPRRAWKVARIVDGPDPKQNLLPTSPLASLAASVKRHSQKCLTLFRSRKSGSAPPLPGKKSPCLPPELFRYPSSRLIYSPRPPRSGVGLRQRQGSSCRQYLLAPLSLSAFIHSKGPCSWPFGYF